MLHYTYKRHNNRYEVYRDFIIMTCVIKNCYYYTIYYFVYIRLKINFKALKYTNLQLKKKKILFYSYFCNKNFVKIVVTN